MPNHIKYTTLQGDTFDIIALDFYHNEKHASKIMQANPHHIGTLVFDAGTVLKIPVLTEAAAETLPPWKR